MVDMSNNIKKIENTKSYIIRMLKRIKVKYDISTPHQYKYINCISNRKEIISKIGKYIRYEKKYI